MIACVRLWLSSPTNRIWLALVAASLASYTLGGTRADSAWSTWTVWLVFGLALTKGVWVMEEFMGLRTAPVLWRRLLLGWLVALCLALAGLSSMG